MKNKLYELAEGFRLAIEKSKSKDHRLNDFPRGCCATASELLQRYLYEKGFITEYIFGECYINGKYESHVWLETPDGIVVDITGDQYYRKRGFFQYHMPVYVGQKDSFHMLFQETDRVPYSQYKPDPLGAQNTIEDKNDASYRIILDSLEKEKDN